MGGASNAPRPPSFPVWQASLRSGSVLLEGLVSELERPSPVTRTGSLQQGKDRSVIGSGSRSRSISLIRGNRRASYESDEGPGLDPDTYPDPASDPSSEGNEDEEQKVRKLHHLLLCLSGSLSVLTRRRYRRRHQAAAQGGHSPLVRSLDQRTGAAGRGVDEEDGTSVPSLSHLGSLSIRCFRAFIRLSEVWYQKGNNLGLSGE